MLQMSCSWQTLRILSPDLSHRKPVELVLELHLLDPFDFVLPCLLLLFFAALAGVLHLDVGVLLFLAADHLVVSWLALRAHWLQLDRGRNDLIDVYAVRLLFAGIKRWQWGLSNLIIHILCPQVTARRLQSRLRVRPRFR